MNKLAIIVILGLAAIASAQVDVEITDLSLKPLPFKNRTNFTIKPFPVPKPLPFKNRTNITGKPITKPALPVFKPIHKNKTNKTVFPIKPIRPFPVNRTNKTLLPIKPVKPINRSNLLAHFKNHTKSKINTTKRFDRILPKNASTTEAVEMFVHHVVNNNNNRNLTQVSTVLQLVGELLLVGSQCEQDLGGAFYVASVVAQDVEAGFQDWQQDVIASVFTGLLAYQASSDCPPVVQIIEELIRIL